MVKLRLFPTENFSDCFVLFSYLSQYQKTYDKFSVVSFDDGPDDKKLTCNFSELLEFLTDLSYSKYLDVFVFGLPNGCPSESVIIFATSFDFCKGCRCIRLF